MGDFLPGEVEVTTGNFKRLARVLVGLGDLARANKNVGTLYFVHGSTTSFATDSRSLTLSAFHLDSLHLCVLLKGMYVVPHN